MAESPNPAPDNQPQARWIDADKSLWKVPVLDVRPVTQRMTLVSKDSRCATNAISYQKDDGTGFAGVNPASNHSVPASLQYRIDGFLADGVLFAPTVMEHKWAIFFHSGRIIFVRLWLRQVFVTADVRRERDFAIIE